ncbi:MAG TPA: multiheme c-type cytochrome [Thermoanaerobaculia bacterium]|nr:multiheme c-type cytochrome [Thermoanaerobaculia bacterium]
MKGIAFAILALAAAAATQQAPAPAPPADTPQGEGRYVGVASCVNSGCHGSTEPLSATLVLQNEYFTWLSDDRHAQAYNVLFDARSARIVRNMRLKKRAYEEPLCLDCHSTRVAAEQVAGQIDLEDGVQCEACHGPASGWRAEHAEQGWTHEQSIARGMIDLRHLPTRAHLCHRCHVGNARQEVDHELIASGHPILVFELDNYAASMPPHWKPDSTDGVRAWAVGQAMKFRDSLANLARHAQGGEWPEFSDMSCYNCHHSLKQSEARQERGWPDRAGLPSWSPQHWSVLRLIIGRVSSQSRDELDPIVMQIARGVARMHDPAGVATNAGRARDIVHELVPRINAARWSEADIRSMMIAITEDAGLLRNADVHAAEQAALALQSLASAQTRRDSRLLRGPMIRSIDSLFEELRDREAFDPARFAQRLRRVREAL